MIAMVFWHNYLLFMLPGLLLGIYAQYKLMSSYRRYSQVASEQGVTGAEAARIILSRAGLHDVEVHETGGQLTDHYDPRKRALFLSSHNYHNSSIAALGVAAHEAGHALQHQAAYGPMQLRMALVPVTQFASTGTFLVFILGAFMGLAKLALLAVVLFGIITLFQLVTLPVEFDASRRAKEQLLRLGLITNREGYSVGKVLNAAAMTYVATMVASLMELLYYAMLLRGDDRN